MRTLPYGDRAVLVEVAGTDEAVALAAAVRDADAPGVGAVVEAACTVLVVAADGTPVSGLRDVLAEVAPRAASPGDASGGASVGAVPFGGGGPAGVEEVVEIPVVYDGADLDDVARLTGLDRDGVVAAHTGQTWRVAFGGFAPGFGYLVGEDDRLHVPRREESRTRVPAGAVGLAGEYAGVYPRESPGGWQLLGRTDAVMWDLDRDPPALLRPGVRVRFVEVGR
ncbi:allophanate hydrolase subunit 1 [Phycicoccus sp. BSK3Z-2]|uniref:Allophanate hydrolase subunit 1 n=1 Tax=Phycicoccus avicenniae TaxID=2828860 RepID=A0A941DBM6_9MICO|nr:allophanate hydrolase subunit 1 [Phycicoccus avicenniae]MBR7744017.1 allophanate hydrolase subunit 1 [Phycicoccus avicenniae]